MRFCYKSAYLKRFDHFSHLEKQLIISADKLIRDYCITQKAPYGLGIKKLYQDGKDKIFEARVSDKIRILWIESHDLITFSIVGSHNEIRNYIKHL